MIFSFFLYLINYLEHLNEDIRKSCHQNFTLVGPVRWPERQGVKYKTHLNKYPLSTDIPQLNSPKENLPYLLPIFSDSKLNSTI